MERIKSEYEIILDEYLQYLLTNYPNYNPKMDSRGNFSIQIPKSHFHSDKLFEEFINLDFLNIEIDSENMYLLENGRSYTHLIRKNAQGNKINDNTKGFFKIIDPKILRENKIHEILEK